MEVFLLILSWSLPLLASIFTLLLVALAKKYIGKLGIERSDKVDNMIDRYVSLGVNSAERMAKTALKTNNVTTSGGGKKRHAVSVVLRELEQSGLKDVGEELISARIESWLEDREPGKLPITHGESTTV